MTLEQLYYIGELAGVVAIIVSLLYVGKQLQQNTKSMRDNASHTYLHHLNETILTLVANRDFAECWSKGQSHFEEFDDVDKQRLILYEFNGMTIWRRSFELHRQGLLSDDVWKEQLGGIEFLSQRQSVRRAWAEFGGVFGHPFRQCEPLLPGAASSQKISRNL